MKLFYSTVNICFSVNPFEAKNKQEYIELVKESYREEYGIELHDSEITDIEEIKS